MTRGSKGSSEEQNGLPLYEVLRLLPEIRALVPLREALLAASSSDAARQWDRSQEYETLDTRVLDPSRLLRVAATVARDEAKAVDHLLRSVADALGAKAQGRTRDAVVLLRDTGIGLLEGERHYEAAALLEVALEETRVLGDPALEAEIARRLAKANWRLGRLDRAATLYEKAKTRFAQVLDHASEVIALQGLGNVRAAQGRLAEAGRSHEAALALCGENDRVPAGQIFNNLSQVNRRLARFGLAWEWQRRAEETWGVVESLPDKLAALNNRGLLHLAEGQLAEARRALLDGLTIAQHDFQRAALLTNLGQVALRSGQRREAEHHAREAEQFAILAGSADVLIEAYIVIGCAARDDGEARCVPFFEKALDLAKGGASVVAEAKAHLEYARYRLSVGDQEEASAHLKRAFLIHQTAEDVVQRNEVLAALGPPWWPPSS